MSTLKKEDDLTQRWKGLTAKEKKLTYGLKVKKQAKILLEALIDAVGGILPENLSGFPKPEWEVKYTSLIIKKLHTRQIQALMEAKGCNYPAPNPLYPYEKPAALLDTISRLEIIGIFIPLNTSDESAKGNDNTGRTEIDYRLNVCSKNKDENLDFFNEQWATWKNYTDKAKLSKRTQHKTVTLNDNDEEVEATSNQHSIEIDWQKICNDILIQAQKHRLTTSPLAPKAMTLEGMHVPLGLVKREKLEPNRPKRDIEPEQGSELYREERVIPVEYGEFMDAVLKAEKPTAVIGEPGAGKTTLLQKIAFDVLDANKDAVVIWVDLAALGAQTLKLYIENIWLGNAAEAAQTDIDTIKEDFKRQRQAGNVWLILDGVDEMDAGSPLSKIARDIQSMRFTKVVLSCRLNVWDGDRNALNDFQVYRNLDFEPDQVNDFIDLWFKAMGRDDGESLKEALKATGKERILDLVRNPLRLTLLCITWQQGESLPDTKAGLYERMVKSHYLWKDGDTSKKFDISDLDKIALHDALGKLAKAGIESETSRFRLRESVVISSLGINLFNVACNLGWLNCIGRAELDESNSAEVVYGFFHTTFQEYFAATAIDDWDFFLPRNHNGKPVDNHPYRIFDKRWREVVLLWLGRSDIDEEKKKEFLGVDAPTGLAQFIESADGCYGFYGWQALLWMTLATSEVYHIECFNSWAEGRIVKAIKLAFNEFNIEHQGLGNILQPINVNCFHILQEVNTYFLTAWLCKFLEGDRTLFQFQALFGNTIYPIEIYLAKIATDEASKAVVVGYLIKVITSSSDVNQIWNAVKNLASIAPNEVSKYINVEALSQRIKTSHRIEEEWVEIITKIATDEVSKSILVEALCQRIKTSHRIEEEWVEIITKIATDKVSKSILVEALCQRIKTSHWIREEGVEIITKIATDEVSKSILVEALCQRIKTFSWSREASIWEEIMIEFATDEASKTSLVKALIQAGGDVDDFVEIFTKIATDEISKTIIIKAFEQNTKTSSEVNETIILVEIFTKINIGDPYRDNAINSLAKLLTSSDYTYYFEHTSSFRNILANTSIRAIYIPAVIKEITNFFAEEYRSEVKEILEKFTTGNINHVNVFKWVFEPILSSNIPSHLRINLVTIYRNRNLISYAIEISKVRLYTFREVNAQVIYFSFHKSIDPINYSTYNEPDNIIEVIISDYLHKNQRRDSLKRTGSITRDKVSKTIIVEALTDYIRDNANIITLLIKAEEWVEIFTKIATDEVSKSIIVKAIIQSNWTSSMKNVAEEWVKIFTKIATDEVSKSIIVEALSQSIKTSSLDCEASFSAEIFAKIATNDVKAIILTSLFKLMNASSDYSRASVVLPTILENASLYLQKFAVFLLSEHLRKQYNIDLYSVTWGCAQNMTYPDFYDAWHDQPTSSHTEVLDTKQIGSSTATTTLDRQVINPSTIQKKLLQTHAESPTLPILIDCSNLLSITNEDTLAARVSNGIFEALSLELPEVDKVAQLERQLSKLRASKQKNIVLILYSPEAPQKIQTLLSTIRYDWLNVLHTSASTQDEILNQLQDWI